MKVPPAPVRTTPNRPETISNSPDTAVADTGRAGQTARAPAGDGLETSRATAASLRAPTAAESGARDGVTRTGDPTGALESQLLSARTRSAPPQAKGGGDEAPARRRPSVTDTVDEALQSWDRAEAEGRTTPAPHRENYFDDVDDVAPVYSERDEQATIGGANRPGHLVPEVGGEPGAGMRVTIHGINDSPEGVQALTDHAAGTDQAVSSFHYDDQRRRLTDSSQDMARELGTWLDEHPGEPLTIDAHSMGSRVSLQALSQLQREGRLEGHQVELNMVAPPLTGYDRANGAANAPDVLNGIAGLQPGRDMGSESDFQHDLEAIRFDDNVRVRVFTGGRDDIVDSSTPEFREMTRHLGAEVIELPDATHTSAPRRAAEWLEAHPD